MIGVTVGALGIDSPSTQYETLANDIGQHLLFVGQSVWSLQVAFPFAGGGGGGRPLGGGGGGRPLPGRLIGN